MIGGIGVRRCLACRSVPEEAVRIPPAGPPPGAARSRGAGPAAETPKYHASHGLQSSAASCWAKGVRVEYICLAQSIKVLARGTACFVSYV